MSLALQGPWAMAGESTAICPFPVLGGALPAAGNPPPRPLTASTTYWSQSLSGPWARHCPHCGLGSGAGGTRPASGKLTQTPGAPPPGQPWSRGTPGPSPCGLVGTWWRVALQQPQELHREPGRRHEVVGVILEVSGGRGDNLGAERGGQRQGNGEGQLSQREPLWSRNWRLREGGEEASGTQSVTGWI